MPILAGSGMAVLSRSMWVILGQDQSGPETDENRELPVMLLYNVYVSQDGRACLCAE